MDLMTIIFICVFIVLLLGIIVVLKKGFNELIKGLESINNRLDRIEKDLKD